MKKSLKTLLPILLLTGLLFGLSMTASAADSGKRGDWINSPERMVVPMYGRNLPQKRTV